MRPEEQQDGQALQEEAQRHGVLAAHAIGEDGDGEAREGADAKHGAHYQGAGGQGQPLGPDDIGQVHDDNGVSGAPPVVDTDEVPEGSSASGLPQKDFGPQPGAGATLHFLDGRPRCGPEGAEPHLGRFVVEAAGEQQQEQPAHNAGPPERPAPAQLGEQHDHQWRKQQVRQALGGL